MDQLRTYADDRLINGCIYCGGPAETRDHVPSRVLLDAPFPENLPVVGACWECNNGFSLDEQYVACLIESVVAGSTDPDHIRRSGVAKILRRSPGLRARIEGAKTLHDGQIRFGVEPERIRNVLLKLARGHAAFEVSQSCRDEPTSVWWCPLVLMTAGEREAYNASHVVQLFGEVGSRGLQRLLVTQFVVRSGDGRDSMLSLLINDWVDVQDGRYRHLAIDDCGAVKIRIVIAEYLACEITWSR
jgi:hypothetical protein